MLRDLFLNAAFLPNHDFFPFFFSLQKRNADNDLVSKVWFFLGYQDFIVTRIFLLCSQNVSVSPVWANGYFWVCDEENSPELPVLGSRTNQTVAFQALMEAPGQGKRMNKRFLISLYLNKYLSYFEVTCISLTDFCSMFVLFLLLCCSYC